MRHSIKHNNSNSFHVITLNIYRLHVCEVTLFLLTVNTVTPQRLCDILLWWTKHRTHWEQVRMILSRQTETVNHHDCSKAQESHEQKHSQTWGNDSVLIITSVSNLFDLSLDLNTCQVERRTVSVTCELTYITKVQTKSTSVSEEWPAGLLCIHFSTHLS